MTGLRISETFELPIDYATSTGSILGKKGSGKSNTGVDLFEEMVKIGIPAVAIDPKGDWWGVRAAGDGGPGLPVPVFGGRHGDVPLEPTAGALIADLILERRLSCVLDVSEFSRADVRRFMLAFGDRLYRQATDEPIHLFLEEAHEYLPQMVRGDDAQLVGAWQRIVKQGRFKGLGVTLISQRSAAVNKDVLTQTDTLFVMRTTSPQDRAAIKAWVDVHEGSDDMLATLPSLASGEGWVWSPEELGVLERVRFRRRNTFDSGATPKVGEKRRAPATLADVDLAAIKDAMSETIEKAKADDPKELRKTIGKLQRELDTARQAPTKPAEPLEVEVLVPYVPDELEPALNTLRDDLTGTVNDALAKIRQIMQEAVGDRRTHVPRERPSGDRDRPLAHRPRQDRPAQRPDPPARRDAGSAPVPRSTGATTDVTLGKGERAVLIAVAQFGSASREQLTVLLGYKRSSRNTYIQRLATAGLVVAEDQRIAITAEGIEVLGDDYEPLPTGVALLEFWENKLGGGEQSIFRLLVDAYPDGVDRETIGEQTGYKRSSYNTYLQRLKSREIVTIDGPTVSASPILFD